MTQLSMGKMDQDMHHSTHRQSIMIFGHRSASEEDSDEDEDEDESSMMNWVIPPVAAPPKPAPSAINTTNLNNNLVNLISPITVQFCCFYGDLFTDVKQTTGWCNGGPKRWIQVSREMGR